MDATPVFSVIVPLECHRGLAEKCIRGWSNGQTFPRSDYQIIVAAPDDHPAAELDQIRSMLTSYDQLLLLPHRHDMDLVAAGTEQARGDFLLFTESHCLPGPGLLSHAQEILKREPGWAGFSGKGNPITHNLLSEIEADMYMADMTRHLEEHPWLKVMDQLFVVRRTALQECGGFESHYGHFAEWILAARLHQRGLKIGYEPSATVHHYYIGEFDDLVEFTDDFACGQMRFALKRGHDPAVSMFASPTVWLERYGYTPKAARSMALLMWRDRHSPATPEERESRRRRWGKWLRRSIAGPAFEIRESAKAVRRLRAETEERLAASDKEGARDAFVRLLEACVDHRHLSVLRDEWKARDEEAFVKFEPKKGSGRWNCGDETQMIKAGFLSREEIFGKTMCWTAPEAMVWLPLAPGKYEIHINWIGFTQMPTEGRYRFYVDERAVPAQHQLELPHGMLLQVHITSPNGARLGWTCAPFHSPGDPRELGMPLAGIAWKRLKKTAKFHKRVVDGAGNAAPPWEPKAFDKHAPLYFLHVAKCMGTTMRLILENAFPAKHILAPWNQFYHLYELEGFHMLRAPSHFVRGHYRWEIVDRLPDRDWRIVTGLRSPEERMLSKFDYMMQLGQLPGTLTLEEWLRHHIQARDTQAAFFIVRSVDDPSFGAEAAAAYLQRHAVEAIEHLRHCAVVGLQERPEESVNLFAWATGALPPVDLQRVNASVRRHTSDGISPEAKVLLEKLTAVDRLLYEEGRKMFEVQHAAMLQDLGCEPGRDLNPHEARDRIRARTLARLQREQASRPTWPTGTVTWKPDDVFPGENLDSRERHDGLSLRWTGPHEETRFHFAMPPGQSWDVAVQLHAATPPEHARAAELWMDGRPVPLAVQWAESGVPVRLEGRIHLDKPVDDAAMRTFVLKSPVRRGNNEWRMLGLCLRGIEFHRAMPEAPK